LAVIINMTQEEQPIKLLNEEYLNKAIEKLSSNE
jgi:hypothetical protein